MTLRRVTLSDRFALDLSTESTRKLTKEGFLVAHGSMSRAGNVQPYTAVELGLEATDRVIKLYRPADEVFSAEALASFEDVPITCYHPPGDVTADNWREYAVGDVHDVKAADPSMDGTLIIRDRYVVDEVVRGYRGQLSCGYSFDLDMTPGTAPGGEAYDGVQRNIRGNHLAIVDLARGGPGCRIHDGHRRTNDEGARPMSIKRVIDGISLEFQDETQASVIEKMVADSKAAAKTAQDAATAATKRATDAETALEAAKADNAKLVADHGLKVKELEGKILKADAIDALVAELTRVTADGIKLMPDLKIEGKTASQIRAEVLAHVVAADDGALTSVAKAALSGVDPAKADAGKACVAFDAVVATAATIAADQDDEGPTRASARDSALANAIVKNRPKTKPLVSRDLWMHRTQHGKDADPAAK